MINVLKKLLLLSFLPLMATSYAEKTEKYKGIAYNKKNEIVYIEKHTATFSKSGKALRASTKYLNAKGQIIGELTSDFTVQLSAPAYKYHDLRHNSGHGIRYTNNKLILIKYQKNGKEKTKPLNEKFSPDSLIVGGQGLHYYLASNLESVKKRKNIPLKFLTPGNLGFYNFQLNYLGKNKDGLLELEVKISNIFLRLFAPKLSIYYNPKNKKLVKYQGLSNITDSKDETQAVTIKYKY